MIPFPQYLVQSDNFCARTLQGRIVADFGQSPNVNAMETADPLSDCHVGSAAGLYIPADDDKPLRVGAYAAQRGKKHKGMNR